MNGLRTIQYVCMIAIIKCVDKIVAYCTYMYRCDSYEQNVYRTLQHTTIHICCTLYSMIAIYAICMECVHEIVGYCTVHYRICVCYEGGKCREPKTGQQKVQLSSQTKHFAHLGMIRFCFVLLISGLLKALTQILNVLSIYLLIKVNFAFTVCL